MAIKENYDISKIEEELTNKLDTLGLEISFDDDLTHDKSTNIYLTSYGLDIRYGYLNSYDSIISLLKGHRVAIICNAKLESEDRSSSKVAKQEMKKHKIEAKVIDLNHDTFDIKKYDALYFSGGEPKYLMDAIIESGLREDFDNFFINDGLVIGQSAGAMIFNKDYLDTTTGELKIMHNGFDMSDRIIVPHYDNLNDKLKKQIPQDILAVNDVDDLIRL